MSALLPVLTSTLSVGKRQPNDNPFDDVVEYGGFPAQIGIKGVKKLEVFSAKNAPNYNAVITGYKATYIRTDGSEVTVSRGLVNVDSVGTLEVQDNEILVGAFGTRKVQSGTTNDGRVASIGFVVFDHATGLTRVTQSFEGVSQHQGKPWGTFGAIIALEGTTKDGVGLTTLGFTKNPDAIPSQAY